MMDNQIHPQHRGYDVMSTAGLPVCKVCFYNENEGEAEKNISF